MRGNAPRSAVMVNWPLTIAGQDLPIAGEQSLKMTLGSLPLFGALAEKMRWHQARQTVLAGNVANANTPGYAERDLEPVTFGDEMKSLARVTTVATSPLHFSVSGGGGLDGFATAQGGFEVKPSGNSVSLEDEMMKISANDMDYQTVTALYMRSMAIIRTALGRSV
jgi:flagellar basal-body rod protein FlgB